MRQTRYEPLDERIQQTAPHLSGEDICMLARIVERLVVAYEPLYIYLFGSKSRGDDGPDSDFDLMIIVPVDAPEERQGSRLALQALRGTGTAADVLVQTDAYFSSRVHLAASLPGTIVREGRLLYAI